MYDKPVKANMAKARIQQVRIAILIDFLLIQLYHQPNVMYKKLRIAGSVKLEDSLRLCWKIEQLLRRGQFLYHLKKNVSKRPATEAETP
jgi:hypothetical protein